MKETLDFVSPVVLFNVLALTVTLVAGLALLKPLRTAIDQRFGKLFRFTVRILDQPNEAVAILTFCSLILVPIIMIIVSFAFVPGHDFVFPPINSHSFASAIRDIVIFLGSLFVLLILLLLLSYYLLLYSAFLLGTSAKIAQDGSVVTIVGVSLAVVAVCAEWLDLDKAVSSLAVTTVLIIVSIGLLVVIYSDIKELFASSKPTLIPYLRKRAAQAGVVIWSVVLAPIFFFILVASWVQLYVLDNEVFYWDSAEQCRAELLDSFAVEKAYLGQFHWEKVYKRRHILPLDPDLPSNSNGMVVAVKTSGKAHYARARFWLVDREQSKVIAQHLSGGYVVVDDKFTAYLFEFDYDALKDSLPINAQLLGSVAPDGNIELRFGEDKQLWRNYMNADVRIELHPNYPEKLVYSVIEPLRMPHCEQSND